MAEEIRLLTSGDHEAFCSILSAFLRHSGGDQTLTGAEMLQLFAKAVDPTQNYFVLGAFFGSDLVGILSLTVGESSFRAAPFAWCDDVYVRDQVRGQGIGGRLIERASILAAEWGCSNILVGVGQDALLAQRFYSGCGFVDLNNRLYTLPLASKRRS